MNTISTCGDSPLDVQKESGGRSEGEPRKVTVAIRQRTYTLNDIGALKKKISHEKRKADIVIEKEAKDLSNVIIPMRASFFEHAKAFFIQDLAKHTSIINIENAEGVKASTESHGEALVEYSIVANEKSYTFSQNHCLCDHITNNDPAYRRKNWGSRTLRWQRYSTFLCRFLFNSLE